MSSSQVPDYPQNAADWRDWLEVELGVPSQAGRKLLAAGKFPFQKLVIVIQTTFAAEAGYSPGFVPALLRNQRGLVR